ncbi:MAG: 50S ribosomal protein L30 [Candidatus Diapherotrites archaeon]|nr:50S ribosomal protein L30 [Candidatus Diapherotrites archaeon]
MIAAIRVRGTVHVREPVERTMRYLNLKRPNHLTLLPEEKSTIRMLKKVENYITWGEIKKETLAKLLEKKAYLECGKRLDRDYLKKHNLNSFLELAEKIEKRELTLEKLKIKRSFRMRPPSKGYGRAGIKKSFKVGGALGYRGEAINELIERML